MNGQGISQILFYAVILVALSYPLGLYMARVYGDRFLLTRGFGWLRSIERGFYRLVRTDAKKEQDWKSYGKTVLIFSIVFSGLLYAIQRLQGHRGAMVLRRSQDGLIRITVLTLWVVCRDRPRSPCATPRNHRPYCTTTGSSRPRMSRTWAICSGDAFSPANVTDGREAAIECMPKHPYRMRRAIGLTCRIHFVPVNV